MLRHTLAALLLLVVLAGCNQATQPAPTPLAPAPATPPAGYPAPAQAPPAYPNPAVAPAPYPASTSAP